MNIVLYTVIFCAHVFSVNQHKHFVVVEQTLLLFVRNLHVFEINIFYNFSKCLSSCFVCLLFVAKNGLFDKENNLVQFVKLVIL